MLLAASWKLESATVEVEDTNNTVSSLPASSSTLKGILKKQSDHSQTVHGALASTASPLASPYQTVSGAGWVSRPRQGPSSLSHIAGGGTLCRTWASSARSSGGTSPAGPAPAGTNKALVKPDSQCRERDNLGGALFPASRHQFVIQIIIINLRFEIHRNCIDQGYISVKTAYKTSHWQLVCVSWSS